VRALNMLAVLPALRPVPENALPAPVAALAPYSSANRRLAPASRSREQTLDPDC